MTHFNVSSQHPVLARMVTPGGSAAASDLESAETTRRIHLPTGGHRFRPALEDVLTMLVTDFAVEPRPGWERRLAEGRGLFREAQTGAAVRDHPHRAVEELRCMGYRVEWGTGASEEPQHIPDSFYRY